MSDLSHRVREKADTGRFVLLSMAGRKATTRKTIEFYFQGHGDGNGPYSTTSLKHAKTFPNRLEASDFLMANLDADRWEVVRRNG